MWRVIVAQSTSSASAMPGMQLRAVGRCFHTGRPARRRYRKDGQIQGNPGRPAPVHRCMAFGNASYMNCDYRIYRLCRGRQAEPVFMTTFLCNDEG
jgi:hypothetical protein